MRLPASRRRWIGCRKNVLGSDAGAQGRRAQGSSRNGVPLGSGGPFGISWTVAVSLGKPRLKGLFFLGFPWILSPESRLINGLHGINRVRVFHAVFALGRSRRRNGRRRRGDAEAQKCSSSELSPCSDFLQSIVVQAAFPQAAPSKGNSARAKLSRLDGFRSRPTAWPRRCPLRAKSGHSSVRW
jgi:hypothetical protein